VSLSDVGSERAILSAIFQHGEDALIDINDIISSKTFTIDSNQLLYTCLVEALQTNKSIDLTAVITTAERLKIADRIINSKQDREFIRSLLNFPIKLENVRGYARRLAKLELARKAQRKHKEAHDNLEGISGNESVDQILAISENAIFDLIQEINQSKEGQPQLISEDSDEILQDLIDNPVNMAGLPTPWPIYNTMIGGGLRRGGVNLIASRPGIGKSNLGKELALHFSLGFSTSIPTLILDTEMQKNDQLFRSLASLSDTEINLIETGRFGQDEETKKRVFEANEKLKNTKIFHEDVSGKLFEEILSIIRRWIVKEVKYDENGNTNDCLIIYDYFKLMSPDSMKDMQEYQALGFQISRLSDFSKEYNFPCMAFVQLNRDGNTKETNDILAQSDRLLWLAHSVAIFKPLTAVEEMNNNANRKMIILKARFGCGATQMEYGKDYINMRFEGNKGKIEELNLKSQEDINRTINEQGFAEDSNKQEKDN